MEMLDHIDDNDRVIESLSREEIYKRKLTHRIVHVLVFNSKSEMLLQLRGKDVSYLPLYWCTAAGGHVQSGESYLQAAKRELEEEIGIKAELEFMFKEIFVNEQKIKKFLGIFKCVYDKPLNIGQEVERAEFFSIEKIKDMIKHEKVHPELIFLIEKHF